MIRKSNNELVLENQPVLPTVPKLTTISIPVRSIKKGIEIIKKIIKQDGNRSL